ncbi:MAG TPA: DMT family transporter [Bacteroidales bacterium]|nr:DMT family transporter [Bacteroidales bacterium]
MPELSLNNIDQIRHDISRQEITFSHLLENLIDHICCDVEHEMQTGLVFSEAYRRVKQKMGSRRLKEIQEETLYAVDTKYRRMKNTMKISGIAGIVLLGFGALFKIQHWPLMGTMTTLGAVTLALGFIPSALGVLWKETHSRKKLFLFISAFLAGMLLIFGTLFKIQHWPGAGIIMTLAALFGIVFFVPALLVSKLRDLENKSMKPVYIFGAIGMICYAGGMFFKIQHWPLAGIFMVIGMIILCIITFPWYTWRTLKEENHISSKFLYMVIGLLVIIIPGTLINLNLQYLFEEGFYSQQEQQQALYGYLARNNNSMMTRYHDSLSYSKMEQLHAKTINLLTLIDDVQIKMVQESEGEPGEPALSQDLIRHTETGTDIQYRKLSRAFHRAPVGDFLVPGCNTGTELNSALTEYKNYLSGMIPGEDLQKYINLLEPSLYLPETMPEEGAISLMSGLHSLELLKNSLLAVESNTLEVIARHK